MIEFKGPGFLGRVIRAKPELVVPDVLDHEIPQPGGVVIKLKGNPEKDLSLKVYFESSQGSLDFDDIYPRVAFKIPRSNELPQKCYSTHTRRGNLTFLYLPRYPESQAENPVLEILHAKGLGHLSSQSFEEQWERDGYGFQYSLSTGFGLSGSFRIDDDERARQMQQESVNAVVAAEEYAWGYALETLRSYREQGLDLVPHMSEGEILEYARGRIDEYRVPELESEPASV